VAVPHPLGRADGARSADTRSGCKPQGGRRHVSDVPGMHRALGFFLQTAQVQTAVRF